MYVYLIFGNPIIAGENKNNLTKLCHLRNMAFLGKIEFSLRDFVPCNSKVELLLVNF